mgnify:CR=1 FL=1
MSACMCVEREGVATRALGVRRKRSSLAATESVRTGVCASVAGAVAGAVGVSRAAERGSGAGVAGAAGDSGVSCEATAGECAAALYTGAVVRTEAGVNPGAASLPTGVGAGCGRCSAVTVGRGVNGVNAEATAATWKKWRSR